MKCPKCTHYLSEPGPHADGLPGILYRACNACGYVQPITHRPAAQSLRVEVLRGTPMDVGFKTWSPTEVAECLEGVDDTLYGTLWSLFEMGDKMCDVWGRLSESDRQKLNSLMEARRQQFRKE